MLKISTEHGSKMPVGKLFRKHKTTLNNIKQKVVLVVHRNRSAAFAWACSKVNEAQLLKFLEINKFNSEKSLGRDSR